MHRVRLVTMDPDDDQLLGIMKDNEIFRERVKASDPGFPEYDYFCSSELALMNMISWGWGEGDWDVERLPDPPNPELAELTAERMLTEAEVRCVPGELAPSDVFDRWCDWQGLVRWGPRLREAMANLLGRVEL